MSKRRTKKQKRQLKSKSAIRSRLLQEFLKRHDIRLNPVLELETRTAEQILQVQQLLNEGMISRNKALASSEVTLALLLNLLSRIQEMLSGSLVSMSAGLGEASEALSRIALEGAITVRYILAGDRNIRLLRYLYAYVEQDERQIKLWNESATKANQAHLTVHKEAIQKRQKANNQWKGIVRDLLEEAELTEQEVLQEPWPSVIDRFRVVNFDSPVSYRTVYARLSSAVHMDAEATLLHLMLTLAIPIAPEMADALSIETAMFGRFMLRYALGKFAEAAHDYLVTFGMEPQADRISELIEEIEVRILSASALSSNPLIAAELLNHGITEWPWLSESA